MNLKFSLEQFWPLLSILAFYILLEFMHKLISDANKFFITQTYNVIRLWLKELNYLRALLYHKDYEEIWHWKPQTQRFVALQAINASGDIENKQRSLMQILLEFSTQKTRNSILISGPPGAGKTTALKALTYRLAVRAYFRNIFAWLLWLGVSTVFSLPVLLEKFGFWSPSAAIVRAITFAPILSILVFAGFPYLLNNFRPWKTPIFVRLSSFDSHDVEEYLQSIIPIKKNNEKIPHWKNRFFFALDGVNEIRRTRYDDFLDGWELIATSVKGVLTSRSGEIPEKLQAQEIHVQELSLSGVKTFIGVYLHEKHSQISTTGFNRWKKILHNKYNSQPKVDVESIFQALDRQRMLVEDGIGRNPYWLNMLIESEQHTRNRGQLVLSFVNDLLTREIEKKRIDRLRKPEWKIVPISLELKALGELALWMNREGLEEISDRQMWNEGWEVIQESLGTRQISADDVLGESQSATLLNTFAKMNEKGNL